MLLVSTALLVAGSVIAAVKRPGFTSVLIGRALQGFGTAVVPIGVGLLSALVSRRVFIGIAFMSGTLGIGSTLGLVLADPLLEWGGPPTVFWCSAVVGALFCILIRLRIPKAPAPAAPSTSSAPHCSPWG